MRVYVAGPMTGYEHYNFAAFKAAQARLIAQGHDAVTPFDANSRVWKRHHGRVFDPLKDRCDYGDPVLAEMFAEDVVEALHADAIALLPGWQKSKGAALEIAITRAFGKTFLDAETGDVMPTPTVSLTVTAAEPANV